MKFRSPFKMGIRYLCALSFVAVAHGAQAVDLLEVYSQALSQSASLQLAKQRYLMELQTEKQGQALLRPSLTAGLRFGETQYRSDTPNFSDALNNLPSSSECISNIIGCLQDLGRRYDSLGSGSTNSRYQATDFSLTLVQPLYDKERWHQYKKTQLLSTRGAIAYKQATTDLIYHISTVYIAFLQAQQNLAQAQREIKTLDRQLKYARSQLEIGLGRSSHLYDLRATKELKQTQLELLQVGLNNALAQLSSLTARPLQQQDIQAFKVVIPVRSLNPSKQQEWKALAHKYNLQLLDAGIDIQLASEEYKERGGARLPKVNFLASYNKTDTSGGQGFIPGAEISSYGVDLSAPLYQGGALSAAEKKAQHQFQASKYKLRQQQSQLELNVDHIYQQIEGQIKSFEILQRALARAKQSQRNLERGASQGIVSVVEVLQGRSNIDQLSSKISTLRFEYLLNKLKLRRLTGVLDERDLVAINSLTQ